MKRKPCTLSAITSGLDHAPLRISEQHDPSEELHAVSVFSVGVY